MPAERAGIAPVTRSHRQAARPSRSGPPPAADPSPLERLQLHLRVILAPQQQL